MHVVGHRTVLPKHTEPTEPITAFVYVTPGRRTPAAAYMSDALISH